ncbi:GEVED domain-containing protein [uncultured Winogradskyella sp.]|uniref:GEVED domain-containing protein n=1 Tax=uncultured Winogradskyella sp. TaxID=395353 RepID=UPI0026368E29|nr:GEVED domain-containing protein [uncultured Winogradskyella sp.]|tara:strand:- start:1521 stop:2324 length:804 start_codon:yes stop_codon:yes gene_type:complete
MKKITLAFLLLTISTQAQTFPDPYCDITPGATIEEITSITFDTTSITNSDSASLLIDQTAIIANVTPGGVNTITVEGNTYGDFDTNIVAFIDWNQNDILDDANEVYAIGTLTNTTGSDGTSVSMDITVPSDALAGTTRIRVTKTYTDSDSTAIIDPCAISFDPFGMGVQQGYGQAIDFTLAIGSLSTSEFDTNALSVYPTIVKNILNIEYNSEISYVKIYNLLGQNMYSKQTNAYQFQLDLSTLTSGPYIVKLFSDKGQYSFKTIKQ